MPTLFKLSYPFFYLIQPRTLFNARAWLTRSGDRELPPPRAKHRNFSKAYSQWQPSSLLRLDNFSENIERFRFWRGFRAARAGALCRLIIRDTSAVRATSDLFLLPAPQIQYAVLFVCIYFIYIYFCMVVYGRRE